MQIRFGAFTIDLDTRQLLQRGRVVHLSPKAFELLVTLAGERPKVLSKDVLLQRLWPGTFVAEANLSNLIAEVRHALGDRARAPKFVRTAHGFGYAFSADATNVTQAGDLSRASSSCWLEWDKKRFPLRPGANVVGRDPDVEIQLDASTVSRRHARFVVTDGGAWLEDLGSKNGTSHNGERIASRVRVADGDTVGFGTLLVTVHVRAGLRSTETQATRSI